MGRPAPPAGAAGSRPRSTDPHRQQPVLRRTQGEDVTEAGRDHPPESGAIRRGRTQTVVATPVRILFIGHINSSSARLVFPAQGLPWPAIESRCHCGYVVGAANAQVCAFREVLPLPAQWESTDPSPRRQGRLGRTDVGHGRIAEAASGIERRPAVVLLGRSIRGRQMSFSRRSTASFQNASGTV
jgi:hypothetical protein